MSTDNEPREIFTHESLTHSYYSDLMPSFRDKSEYIHTIEIAAVEQLSTKLKIAKLALEEASKCACESCDLVYDICKVALSEIEG